MTKYIFNHSSFKTALEVKDYPYGFRLRTSIFYWIESEPKKGDRFCSCTINPKNGRVNATKKSTYSNIGAMFLNEDGHVKFTGIGIYTEKEKLEAWIATIGEENLNDIQKFNLKQLRGVSNGQPTSKAFKIKWEGRTEGIDSELSLTFDRPDGVQVKEIFEALKTVNQERLLKMFDGWESKGWGHVRGFVRVKVRGGIQLTTIEKNAYISYLASDHNTDK